MVSKKIKSLFITQPQWLPLNPPYCAVPFVSYLKEKGYDAYILDLNIKYYLYILNKNYLLKQLETAQKLMPDLFKYLSKHFKQGLTPENYNDEFKSKLLKYNKIKEFLSAKKEAVKNAIETIEYSLKVLKDKELFYNPKELINAATNIDFCLEIASLPYFPALIQMNNYSDPFFKLDFKTMLKSAQNDNMFLEFCKKMLPEIKAQNPDVVGISINSTSQIVASLTLCYLLKKEKNLKIVIGGNFFSRVVDTVKKYPDFFKYFCDYLMIDEGEIPVYQLMQHLEGEIKIDEVSNVLYLKDEKVVENPICKPLPMQEMVIANLDDFNLDEYLTPDIVLPAQSSRGCYWGKCSFCDHDFGQKLSIKPVDKFVDELKETKRKYGIKHFELIDECISPKYLKEMSERILANNLEIFWFNNARLENEFDENVLSVAQNAGLRMLLWGFESGSKKIMEEINKGIDIDKRTEILTRARRIGIWNFAFIFFGFPSETKDDARETIEYIKNHTDIISSYGRSVFTLGKHTTLRQTPDKFNITKIYQDVEEFSPSYHFETSVGMNEKEINQIAQVCLQECNAAYNNPLWMYLFQREILFLYICKYGADKVEDMKVSP